MHYSLSFRPYSRRFRQPLQTHHGWWHVRKGLILRLTSADGRSSFGEIAPIAWFGSERLEQAIAFCQQLLTPITADAIFSIPSDLPACQFGFESAWELLTQPQPIAKLTASLGYSQLLPTGRAAIEAMQVSQSSTFKWKIGVASLNQELKIFEEIVACLPQGSKLRLDANGGLNWDQACQWLEVFDDLQVNGLSPIEFLEQPLPIDQFELMQKLSSRYATPIALDESVATLEQLEICEQRGWQGIFVIKPAIAGSIQRLRQFCQNSQADLVWSSVFETAIARHFIETRLITSLPDCHRALGFGINQWFNDGFNPIDFEHLWQTL
jgi:o-succinylbenzoate synthase